MDLEELFDQNKRNRKQAYDQNYRNNDEEKSHSEHDQNNMLQNILNKLKENPRLKVWLIIAAIVVVILIVIAAILLFPFLVKIFNIISEKGFKGLIDAIWSGSK